MKKVTMPQSIFPWSNSHEAIILFMVLLLLAGAANVFSATFIMSENESGNPYAYILKHLVSMGIGMAGFYIAYRVDYHKWEKFVLPVTALVFISLIVVLVAGTTVNGATRWLYIGPTSVQPAEFAKVCSVMLEAYYLAGCIKHRENINLLHAHIGIIFIMAIVVEMEPDMGTACVVFGVPVVMIAISGLSTKKIEYLVGGVIALFAAAIVYQPYRLERLKVTFDPWSDAQGIGYQTVQSLTAIGSGEFWGMGIGRGLAKYAYLPEAHTDFALAVFCQENGFLLALLLLIGYGAFAYFAARISADAYDAYGQVLAAGIMTLIVGQAVVNMMMVMGCFPVVGVPLPFISYGGSSLIANMFAVGILVSIDRYSLYAKKRQEKLQANAPKAPQPAGAAGQARPRLRLVK